METLLSTIAWSLISLLVLMLNTFVTGELTDILKDGWLDKRILYRVCLIPPIGFAVYLVGILLIVLSFFIEMMVNIWKK
jgi:hypothetical protein